MLNRRAVIGLLGTGAFAGATRLPAGAADASEQRYSQATRGLRPLKITGVKAILTRPSTARLVVVKVETSEPGLYGLGCATFSPCAPTVHP